MENTGGKHGDNNKDLAKELGKSVPNIIFLVEGCICPPPLDLACSYDVTTSHKTKVNVHKHSYILNSFIELYITNYIFLPPVKF